MTTNNMTAATVQQLPGKHTLMTAGDVIRILGCTRKAFLRWQDSIPQLDRRRGPRGKKGWRRYRWGDVLAFFENAIATPAEPDAPRPRLRPRPNSNSGFCGLEDCPEL
jgi:hypothetical protein